MGTTGAMAEINPLRYRGYYYDTDSELYYVSSRYYDAKIGRFSNLDSAYDTNQGTLGYNMYAYCLNNPINKTGKTNGWAVAGGAGLGILGGGIIGAGIGAAISALGATATATTAGGTIAQAAPAAYKTWQNAEQGLRESINSVADYASRVIYTPRQ